MPAAGSAAALVTGRLLVTTASAEPVHDDLRHSLRTRAGIDIALAEDLRRDGTRADEVTRTAGSVLFDRLGVAVVAADADQAAALNALVADPRSPIVGVEPERYVFATAAAGSDADEVVAADWSDSAHATWGVEAVGALGVDATGQGVRVAVLDTGIDRDHPALAGAVDAAASFVAGEGPDDGNGHGTHVAGTVAASATAPRYGVAPAARLLAAKVLSDEGTGTDATVLDGVEWALEHSAALVSLSLGSPWDGPPPFSVAFETVAGRALDAGVLLIAAAGNDSRRDQGIVAPVGSPANAPSILAVGAVDARAQMADFSNGSVLPGGQIDVVGPGVDVLSAWPGGGTHSLSGTSMATPHVTGVAALLIERDRPGSARELLARLLLTARRLHLPATASGAGLAAASY